MNEASRKSKFNILYILAAIFMISLLHDLVVYKNRFAAIPYSQFLTELEQKKIESVSISNSRIEGNYKGPIEKGRPASFYAMKIEDPSLTQKLSLAGVRFEAIRENTFFRDILSWIIPALVFVGFWWLLLGRAGKAQGSILSMGRAKAKVYAEQGLKIKFSDVAGVDEAKEELLELVQFLKDPKKFNRLGGRMPKGMLLVGPPGTGKTLLARAVAGEAGVPFYSINGSEFVELFVGLGAARVRDLFLQAREHAPCIIFIDELDALGKARGISAISTGGSDEKEQTLNQLLAEIDGFDPSQGVVLLAATNRPEVLDPALLRSGRFDRQIMIDKPDRKGREDILKIHLRGIRLSISVNTQKIASLTAGFSGADLANLVNEAALIATRRSADTVEEADFTAGIERIVGGLERKSRILSPEEKKRVAYHEMGHVAVSLALDPTETVHKVSVIPRGLGALGYTMRRPTEDRYLVNREELENKLATFLGGRASEALFLKDISTGAADDLDKATDLARAMVTRYGMSDRLGLLTYDREVAPLLSERVLPHSHDYSDETAKLIDQETLALVGRAFEQASKIVSKFKGFIETGVLKLLEKETLDEAELQDLWNSERKEAKLYEIEKDHSLVPRIDRSSGLRA